jgi:indolepyruvate ferredoxin oxidoreductase
LARIAAVEQRVRPGSQALQEFVARSYFSVLAYKDEYEVARLHTESGFVDSVKRNFGAGVRMSFHFSPPLFAGLDPATGRPKKYELGPWVLPILRVLAKLRWLRGKKLDPFRWSADRRLERELLARYEAALDRIGAELDDARFDLALSLARLPEQVRGYGPIKSAAATRAMAAERQLWQPWDTPSARVERTHASAA